MSGLPKLRLLLVVIGTFMTFGSTPSTASQDAASNPTRTTGAVRVVILGSSTAQGEAARPLSNSWANKFQTYLQNVLPGSDLINLAIGGYTTFNVMPTGYAPPAPWNTSQYQPAPSNNITRALELKPSIIIINLPTNDCALYIPVSVQMDNYRRIVSDAEQAGIRVWITTPQPRNVDPAGRSLLLSLLAATKAQYAGRILDFWTGLADNNGFILSQYNYDGTHLNSDGHTVLYNRVVQTVDAAMPVQLGSFAASVLPGDVGVLLRWNTVSETNSWGFEVQKSANDASAFGTIGGGFVPGHGTTIEPHSYSFTDATGGSGIFFYRLKQIDLDGTVHFSESVRPVRTTEVDDHSIPKAFALNQNYPNPFNPSTTISFDLPDASFVRLSIVDMLGKEVGVLVDERRDAGTHAVIFNADVASGVYFYKLQVRPLDSAIGRDSRSGAGEYGSTKRMMLLH